MSIPNGLSHAQSQREAIGQNLKGSVLSNIRKLFTNQALERSEQNFVTKFNHVTHLAWGLYIMSMLKERSEQNFVTKLNHVIHLAWGLYYMSMPNGVPQARSQGVLQAKT